MLALMVRHLIGRAARRYNSIASHGHACQSDLGLPAPKPRHRPHVGARTVAFRLPARRRLPERRCPSSRPHRGAPRYNGTTTYRCTYPDARIRNEWLGQGADKSGITTVSAPAIRRASGCIRIRREPAHLATRAPLRNAGVDARVPLRITFVDMRIHIRALLTINRTGVCLRQPIQRVPNRKLHLGLRRGLLPPVQYQ